MTAPSLKPRPVAFSRGCPATRNEHAALAYLATRHPRPLRQLALLDGLADAGLNTSQALEAFCMLTSSGLVRLRRGYLSLTRQGVALTAVAAGFLAALPKPQE